MQLIFLTAALTFSIGFPAHAGDELREELNKSLAVCDSKWNTYTNGLDDVKSKAVRYISSLSEDDFYKLWDADDQLVVFISGTWPEILKYKPNGPWAACVAQHTELVRRQISDRSMDPAKREQAVRDWSDCVTASYDGQKLIKPFDKVVACYLKQARTFKE